MSPDKPQVTRADADNVVQKLRDLRESLPAGEQLVLDNVVAVFEDRVSDPQAQELLKDFPDAPELLEEVAGFQLAARPKDPAAITPTWTLTTTVTVAASHPWITCNLQAPGGAGATRG